MRRFSIIIIALIITGFLSVSAQEGGRQIRRHKVNREIPVPPKVERTRSDDYGIYDGWGRDTGGAVRLIRAKELRQIKDKRGELTILDWDVKIIQDSLSIWCDLGRYWRSIGRLEMNGNVIMIDPQRSLDADRVIYYEKRKETEAIGNVNVLRDSVFLSSQRGEYHENFELARVSGDMFIHDLRRDIVLTGDNGVYEAQSEKANVPVNPVLVQLDSTGEEKARIIGREMRYDGIVGLAEAIDDVYLVWGEVEGKCNHLYFYPDDSKALMLGDPQVWQNRDEVIGDSIWIYLLEESLDSVEVFKNAVAFTVSDSSENSPRNKMTGQRIVMDFDDGEVVRMQSQTQTVATYHLFEEGEDKGSNRVSGDEITLIFKDGELDQILVNGGTEGTFYPPHLAKKIRQQE